MTNIYLHSEDRTLATVLARIRGEPVKQRQDLEPMYGEAVPEPNRSLLLRFHRSLVTEELCLGRICVLMGNMYRVSIWLNHKPFEELTKDDLIDLVEKIRRMKVKRNAKATVREGYAEQTIESYKITLKKFWKWMKPMERPGEYPPHGRRSLIPSRSPSMLAARGGTSLRPTRTTAARRRRSPSTLRTSRPRGGTALVLGGKGSGALQIGFQTPTPRKRRITGGPFYA